MDDFLREIAQHFITGNIPNELEAKVKEFYNIKEVMMLPYGKDGMLGKLSIDIRDFFMNIK